jgi:hypothetical protein
MNQTNATLSDSPYLPPTQACASSERVVANPELKKLRNSAINGLLAAIVFASALCFLLGYVLMGDGGAIPTNRRSLFIGSVALFSLVLFLGTISLVSLLCRQKYIALICGALSGIPLCLLFPLGTISGVPGFPIFLIGTFAGALCIANLFKPAFITQWFDEKRPIYELRAIDKTMKIGVATADTILQLEYCPHCRKDVTVDEDFRCLECKWPVD